MIEGKIVLITGAKGGLGTFVTQAFLDAGAQVVGTSRSISASDFVHPNFAAEPAELGDAEQARELASRVVARWKRIDALVHLVGGFTGGHTVAETEEATFGQMFATNFYSFFHLVKAVLPQMQEQGGGTILAVGSRTAVEPAATVGAYSASKAALVSLVRTIALENKDKGISANLVLPGTMDTPVNRSAMPGSDFSRWVQPSQVASTLVHLASTPNVTGAAIPIYGSDL